MPPKPASDSETSWFDEISFLNPPVFLSYHTSPINWDIYYTMFSGSAIPQKKISLGGKSQRAESRDDLLEKTRLERERRRRDKLEDVSARQIQVRCLGVDVHYQVARDPSRSLFHPL